MKTISIILIGVLILSLIFVCDYYFNKDNEINFGNIEISSKQFKDITEPLAEGRFVLCSLENNQCILAQKFELGEQDD